MLELHTPVVVPFCKNLLNIWYLLILSCTCHVFLRLGKRNFNYGNKLHWEWRALYVPSITHGVLNLFLPVLPHLSAPSSLPIFIRPWGSLFPWCKLELCALSISAWQGRKESWRKTCGMLINSPMEVKVFHRNEHGNAKEKAVHRA